MTGLVIKRTPELKASLERLRARLQKEGVKPKSAPAQRTKAKFLPGESRATVGSDGFRDFIPRETYGRFTRRNQNYNNGRLVEQDLARPVLNCHINIGGEAFSPWELDCAERTTLKKLCCQLKGAEYRARFLQSILTAEYVIWRLGNWAYYGV